MKKLIQSVLFLVLLGCSPATAQYFQLGKTDSFGTASYHPVKYLESWDVKGSDQYLLLSAGVSKDIDGNVFYGVYVDFDAALTKKDTLLAIFTERGSYLLREAKISRDKNVSNISLFIPDVNPDGFYEFITNGAVTKISYSGAYFKSNINPDYFEKAFSEVIVMCGYVD